MKSPTILKSHAARANGLRAPAPRRVSLVRLGIQCASMIFLLSIGLLNSRLHAQGSGIVIFKDNTAMPDGSAKVMEYATIRRMGEITQYFTTHGQSIRLTKFQPQVTVAYPDLMARTITEPGQLGMIENGLASYRGIVRKYPKTVPFLSTYIQSAEEIQRRVRGGEILFNGAFMTKGDYESLIKREEEISTQHLEKTRDRNRLEREKAMRVDIENRRRKQ